VDGRVLHEVELAIDLALDGAALALVSPSTC